MKRLAVRATRQKAVAEDGRVTWIRVPTRFWRRRFRLPTEPDERPQRR